MKECIVITMPLRDARETVSAAIASFVRQRGVKRELVLLIGDDSSTDDSMQIVGSFLPHPGIKILEFSFGKIYQCRNYLYDYARKHIPGCVLIGRLDTDDVLWQDDTMARIESIFEETDFDVFMAGNKQQRDGKILEWENRADPRLLKDDYLLQRLLEMSQGNPRAELPSCNTFIRPSVQILYPPKDSAEDHWFSVLLLLEKDRLKIHLAEDFLYCIYSLNGLVTESNRKKEAHQKNRAELYEFFKRKMKS